MRTFSFSSSSVKEYRISLCPVWCVMVVEKRPEELVISLRVRLFMDLARLFWPIFADIAIWVTAFCFFPMVAVGTVVGIVLFVVFAVGEGVVAAVDVVVFKHRIPS